MRNILTGTVVF